MRLKIIYTHKIHYIDVFDEALEPKPFVDKYYDYRNNNLGRIIHTIDIDSEEKIKRIHRIITQRINNSTETDLKLYPYTTRFGIIIESDTRQDTLTLGGRPYEPIYYNGSFYFNDSLYLNIMRIIGEEDTEWYNSFVEYWDDSYSSLHGLKIHPLPLRDCE